ncbi:acidic mammalian chitinase-like isoform X2 [Bacillus rossius redtenbacheri]
MAQSVDFISIMTYDYHFYIWYLPVTGYNAPLYPQMGDEGYFLTLNINWSVNYWMLKGMPKEKIMIGLPTYGHTFSLLNPNNHNLRAPATGIGSVGSNGYISYDQVCWFLKNGDASVVFDGNSRVPYAFNTKDWISYENEQSLAYKAEYIVNGEFAGAMVFSLSTDDFQGHCSGGNVKFPLTRHIKLVLTDDEL